MQTNGGVRLSASFSGAFFSREKKVRCSAGIVNDVHWFWDATWEPGEGLD